MQRTLLRSNDWRGLFVFAALAGFTFVLAPSTRIFASPLTRRAQIQELKKTDIGELKPGAAAERQLAGTDQHIYRVQLTKGQYLNVGALQKVSTWYWRCSLRAERSLPKSIATEGQRLFSRLPKPAANIVWKYAPQIKRRHPAFMTYESQRYAKQRQPIGPRSQRRNCLKRPASWVSSASRNPDGTRSRNMRQRFPCGDRRTTAEVTPRL